MPWTSKFAAHFVYRSPLRVQLIAASSLLRIHEIVQGDGTSTIQLEAHTSTAQQFYKNRRWTSAADCSFSQLKRWLLSEGLAHLYLQEGVKMARHLLKFEPHARLTHVCVQFFTENRRAYKTQKIGAFRRAGDDQ